jgi:hypothetical protein
VAQWLRMVEQEERNCLKPKYRTRKFVVIKSQKLLPSISSSNEGFAFYIVSYFRVFLLPIIGEGLSFNNKKKLPDMLKCVYFLFLSVCLTTFADVLLEAFVKL